MNISEIDLNDFLLVAMIDQTGSLAGAANALQINHATVFRRLTALESKLGITLFNRNGRTYVATPQGKPYVDAGKQFQNDAELVLAETLGTQSNQLRGRVRITTTESILRHLLGDWFTAHVANYPEIQYELILSQEYLNLSKRDADIAIRPCIVPPDNLIGRHIADIDIAIFGTAALLGDTSPNAYLDTAQLRQMPWVCLDDRSSPEHLRKVIQYDIAPAHIMARTNTMESLLWMAQQGSGVALLPLFLARNYPALIQLSPVIPEAKSQLWVLMHPDFRQTPRIKITFDHLVKHLQSVF